MSFSIRLPEELQREFNKLLRPPEITKAAISKSAIRKFKRLLDGDVTKLPQINYVTKGSPTTIEMDRSELAGIKVGDFRLILAWYFSYYKDVKEPPPVIIPQEEIDALYGYSEDPQMLVDLLSDKRVRVESRKEK